jgi:lysozyme
MTPDQLAQACALAAPLVRAFEGFRPVPYLCPAGYPTIGFGSRWYLDGRAVTLQDAPITRAVANVMLRDTLRRLVPRVLVLCPRVDTPGRLAALLDFTFNLGEGNLRASTLRRRINAGRWEEVPKELKKWVRGGGRELPGLVRRRQAECDLLPHGG